MPYFLGKSGSFTIRDSRAESTRAGQSLVSVLVGAGISMAMLGGVITMIQYSQKAGQGVQGKSDFGALVDSVRSITSSADACKAAFVDASGLAVKIAAPSATADSSVEAQAIRVGGADFIRKGEKAGAVLLQSIQLTRPKGTSDLLSVQLVGQKQGEVLGTRDLQNVKPFILQASFGSDDTISSCQMGAGAGAGVGVAGIACRTVDSGAPVQVSETFCSATEHRTGGGCKEFGSAYMYRHYPVVHADGREGWHCASGSTGTLSTAYAICCRKTVQRTCQRLQFPTKDMGVSGVLRIQGHDSYASTAIQWCKEQGFTGPTTRIKEYNDSGNRALWGGTAWGTNVGGVTIEELECCAQ